MRNRLAGLVLAIALAIVPVCSAAAFPLCAIYTPDDVEYYLFFCYVKVEGSRVAAIR